MRAGYRSFDNRFSMPAQYPIHGSKYFDCRELVDPVAWNLLNTRVAWMIDPAIIRVLDLVRELAGSAVKINNWHYAKKGEQVYTASGYRAQWENTGGRMSQHRCGRAADLKVAGFSPSLLLTLIQNNKAAFVAAGLTTFENVKYTPTWLHLDVRPRLIGVHPENDFLQVDP